MSTFAYADADETVEQLAGPCAAFSCTHKLREVRSAECDSMASLYRRLYTYRQRPDRHSIENFLTEALADLLDRLPEPLARRTVEKLLSQQPSAVEQLESVWPPGAVAKWTTQRMADGRILDLLLEVDGVPIVVIENKIAAGFQDQEVVTSEGETGRGRQLASYGHWLARETHQAWGGALILLTHWTPAPNDFTQAGQTYGCRYRSTYHWAGLCRWLRTLSRGAEHESEDWSRLASELVTFLREENMDSELATGHDLAALRIYVASADRVRNSVERIWESARSVWRPLCIQTSVPLEVSTAYGCVWKYRYLSRPDLRSCYLAAGIRYPEIGDWYSTHLSSDGGPYLFVELGSEGNAEIFDRLAMPDHWQRDKAIWIATRSLQTLNADAEHLVVEGEDWARQRVTEVAQALS